MFLIAPVPGHCTLVTFMIDKRGSKTDQCDVFQDSLFWHDPTEPWFPQNDSNDPLRRDVPVGVPLDLSTR